jgi:hypothetical protein
MAMAAAGPDAVAKAIEKSIRGRKAPTRVKVAPSAHLMMAQRKLVTDGIWDRMMRVQFPQPGK